MIYDIVQDYSKIGYEIEHFKPDMIMFVAGGLSFSKETSSYLKKERCYYSRYNIE